jgi:hypothetical protein
MLILTAPTNTNHCYHFLWFNRKYGISDLLLARDGPETSHSPQLFYLLSQCSCSLRLVGLVGCFVSCSFHYSLV